MPVEGGQCDLVKVDKSNFGHTGADEHVGCPGADTSTPYDNDECFTEFLQTFIAEKESVSGELLKDDLCPPLVSSLVFVDEGMIWNYPHRNDPGGLWRLAVYFPHRKQLRQSHTL